MRRTLALTTVALALVVSACSDVAETFAPPEPSQARLDVAPSFQLQSAERVMPGRVLARFVDGADPAEVARGAGLELASQQRGFAVLRGAVGNERALAARLGTDARVVWAEPDFLREPHAIDSRLWAFHNPGGLAVYYTRGRNNGSPVTSYLSVADADMDVLEGIGVGGGPVAIASIDTGVDFGHPEFLPGQIVAGYDYYDNDPDPSDSDGHGTHTTGTMVGQTVGVAGVTGAGGNVTVHVYRVCGSVGCPQSAIVSAIYAATDAGVVAMNLSLGGGSLGQAEADAIAYATANGALVIASAGNDGTGTVSCPACDPNAISVAASDWLDEHAYYTNYGSGLDITAPGGELYSNTTSESGIYSSVPGGYAYYQGTSMSAPQVTGTAAVVASVNSALRGATLRARLEGSADDLGPSGYDTQFGHGRLNTHAAVTGGGGEPPPPPPPPPTLAAAFSYSCSGLDCSFDGSASTGDITSYAWTFGDGGSGSGVTASHSYAGAGSYTVTLTVSDGTGSDTATDTVTCSTRGKKVRCN